MPGSRVGLEVPVVDGLDELLRDLDDFLLPRCRGTRPPGDRPARATLPPPASLPQGPGTPSASSHHPPPPTLCASPPGPDIHCAHVTDTTRREGTQSLHQPPCVAPFPPAAALGPALLAPAHPDSAQNPSRIHHLLRNTYGGLAVGPRGPGSPHTDGWLHTCRLYLFAATRPPYAPYPRARALPARPLHLDRPGPGVLAVVSLTTCVRTT